VIESEEVGSGVVKRSHRVLWVAGAFALYAVILSMLGPLVAVGVFFSCDTSCDLPGGFQARAAPYGIAAVMGGILILALGVAWIIGKERSSPP
jgi:hypothetical protein